MKNYVICILDKSYPPEHSFVDGMLADELAAQARVFLLVSRGTCNRKVVRYGRAICLPILGPRTGVSRFLNFFLVLRALIFLRRRVKSRRIFVSIFVRNEPIYLIAAAVLKSQFERLVFQQSFPHEKAESSVLKREFAKFLFRSASNRVDAITAVSPTGLQRLVSYFPCVKNSLVIPLLGSQSTRQESCIRKNLDSSESVKFLYVGSHSSQRELSFVLRGICLALQMKNNLQFTFIGGKEDEVRALCNSEAVSNFVRNRVIQFHPRMPRDELLKHMPNYDVGISLIPPTEVYAEASPTKLAEYMSSGLAILASNGIPSQEEFMKLSGGGILTNWSVEDIANSLITIASSRSKLDTFKISAFRFSEQSMNYSDLTNALLDLLFPQSVISGVRPKSGNE